MFTPFNDNSLQIKDYNLVQSYYPNDVKRWGVSIFCRESLLVRVMSIPCLKKALLLEFAQNNNDNKKKMFVSLVYPVSHTKMNLMNDF